MGATGASLAQLPTLGVVPPLEPHGESRDWVVLTTAKLPAAEAEQWAATPSCGAVVAFRGIVRDHAEGRHDVYAMTYEAYEQPALDRLNEIAIETRSRWADLNRIAIFHRLGELKLGEDSVVVVASSPHRDVAFEAARFAIDTIKTSVPIWKKEHFADASEWALGAHDVVSIPAGSTSAAGER